MKTLPSALEQHIEKLCDKADAHFENDRYEEAISLYQEALQCLPEPLEEYEPSAWLLSSIGDVLLFTEQYEEALNYFEHALECVDTEDNPYLFLRLGETLYELHRDDEAAEALYEAYLIEGEDIFSEEDPALFEFLKSKKVLPE
jgi:tetratricopeptide (TPR) repeat protein